MKQTTAQQFANIFGVYVAKEVKDSSLFAYELKPIQQTYEDGTCWCMKKDCFSIEITPLISDAGSLDWNVLIEPQEEHAEPQPVSFDENYAPEGYKAVKMNQFEDCPNLCPFYDESCSDKNCQGDERPDRTDVYFVKKEDEK